MYVHICTLIVSFAVLAIISTAYHLLSGSRAARLLFKLIDCWNSDVEGVVRRRRARDNAGVLRRTADRGQRLRILVDGGHDPQQTTRRQHRPAAAPTGPRGRHHLLQPRRVLLPPAARSCRVTSHSLKKESAAQLVSAIFDFNACMIFMWL